MLGRGLEERESAVIMHCSGHASLSAQASSGEHAGRLLEAHATVPGRQAGRLATAPHPVWLLPDLQAGNILHCSRFPLCNLSALPPTSLQIFRRGPLLGCLGSLRTERCLSWCPAEPSEACVEQGAPGWRCLRHTEPAQLRRLWRDDAPPGALAPGRHRGPGGVTLVSTTVLNVPIKALEMHWFAWPCAA